MKNNKMKLTPVQKEALSHTPLFLAQSESNLNKFSWVSNMQQKQYQFRTIGKLMENGLLCHPIKKHRGVPSEETDELRLTDKAIEMGFVENLNDEPTEYDIDRTKKKRKKSTAKETELIKELRKLEIIAEGHGLDKAKEFLSKIINA